MLYHMAKGFILLLNSENNLTSISSSINNRLKKLSLKHGNKIFIKERVTCGQEYLATTGKIVKEKNVFMW